MKVKIKKLKTSETSFKAGIYLGFLISLGLTFFIYTSGNKTLELIFQLTIGTGFIGIIFNVLIMCLTSILLFLFPNLLTKYTKEKLFNLVVRTHIPLFLGIIIGLFRLINFEVSRSIIFWTLELISLTLLIYNLNKTCNNNA
ncbi:hypothetical protein EZ428_21220 [Pedobacter frigiditerrae]|uniref:Uncharacterized protein n=1 Tax=Pedobacter frigiditerrae TaxID=2530452 RepID=A0A4R0MQG4_9SPHI|nr:hypothetical protein EZ428_21220 [Pedobacter frigiditerrae]